MLALITILDSLEIIISTSYLLAFSQ